MRITPSALRREGKKAYFEYPGDFEKAGFIDLGAKTITFCDRWRGLGLNLIIKLCIHLILSRYPYVWAMLKQLIIILGFNKLHEQRSNNRQNHRAMFYGRNTSLISCLVKNSPLSIYYLYGLSASVSSRLLHIILECHITIFVPPPVAVPGSEVALFFCLHGQFFLTRGLS